MSLDLSCIEQFAIGDNLRSFLIYQSELKGCTKNFLQTKDLLMLPVHKPSTRRGAFKGIFKATELPFLINGSNQYGKLRSSSVAKENLPSFVNQTFLMNGNFFVMPEAQTVHELQGLCGTAPVTPKALGSWVNQFRDQFHLTRLFLEALSVFRSSHMVRWFDSHLSMTSYVLFCIVYFKYIGLELSPELIARKMSDSLVLRSYTPDLAVRFSEKEGSCFFPSQKFIVRRVASSDGRQRGTYLLFRNSDSSLIKRELFLFGDSHCFSALAPLMSHVFETVHAYWGIPDDFVSFISRRCVTSNPRLLVECTERFFLKNSQ